MLLVEAAAFLKLRIFPQDFVAIAISGLWLPVLNEKRLLWSSHTFAGFDHSVGKVCDTHFEGELIMYDGMQLVS